MDLASNASKSALPASDLACQCNAVSQRVQGILDFARNKNGMVERRCHERHPIPFTFRLTPISQDDIGLSDDATIVVGKNLSLSGIGFTHDHPLPYRHAVLTLEHPKLERFEVEVEIVWSRTTPLGHCESGCRLVRMVGGFIFCRHHATSDSTGQQPA